MPDNIFRFLIVCITCFISVCIFVYTVGLSHNERSFILSKIIYIYKKTLHNDKYNQ